MQERLGDFSVREKNLWFDLLVDVVVALYYYPRLFGLMQAGDAALTGASMVRLIINTVILAIVASVVLRAFLHIKSKPEPKDERDFMIDARSSLWYGRVLVAGILLLMGQIVLQQFNPWTERELFQMSPVVIANLLLLLLMIASMVGSVLKILMYRRGA